jgi:hypothetical protein
MTAHLDILTVPPDRRSQRIAEVSAVLRDLQEHPLDLEVYDEELAETERELLRLLVLADHDSDLGRP